MLREFEDKENILAEMDEQVLGTWEQSSELINFNIILFVYIWKKYKQGGNI